MINCELIYLFAGNCLSVQDHARRFGRKLMQCDNFQCSV